MSQIEFPVNVIGKLEQDNAEFAHVYHYYGELLEQYNDNRQILALVKKRWKFLEKAVHGLSYLLTPRFVINGRFFTDKEEVASSIAKFVLDRGANSDVADAVLLEMSAYVNHIASLNGVTKQLVEGMNATQYWTRSEKKNYRFCSSTLR